MGAVEIIIASKNKNGKLKYIAFYVTIFVVNLTRIVYRLILCMEALIMYMQINYYMYRGNLLFTCTLYFSPRLLENLRILEKCVKICDKLEKKEIEDILRTEFGLLIDMADVDISKSADIKYVETLAEEEREAVVNKLIAAPGLSLN